MINIHDTLTPHKPEIITSGVVEVVSFFDKMDPKEAVRELLKGEVVLVEDYYHNGLQILKTLRATLKQQYNTNSFQGERNFRAKYRKVSHRLLLMVDEHELVVKKSPEIGWFEELYPDEEYFLIPFPEVQGLNSSWQWYLNGLEVDVLGLKLHPYYGVYFPTRFDHLELFDQWLQEYDGTKDSAIDIGVGCGVLSFQLLQHGFSSVVGTDTNRNAIINTTIEAHRLDFASQIELIHGDLFANYNEKLELIVFNPPWLVADHPLTEGIDSAIYYEMGLFDRFFEEAIDHLQNNGKLVIIFSNLGQVVGQDKSHPIKRELGKFDRFTQEELLTKSVQSSSTKTKRKDWRDTEKVELWVLVSKH